MTHWTIDPDSADGMARIAEHYGPNGKRIYRVLPERAQGDYTGKWNAYEHTGNGSERGFVGTFASRAAACSACEFRAANETPVPYLTQHATRH